MRSRVLVTGACGLLGSHLMARLGRGREVTGTDRHPWWGDQPAQVVEGDLSAPDFLRALVDRVRPEAVVHCAAMTDVEACEKDPAAALALNAGVTGRLVRSLSPGCLFLYLSTDAIFGGDAAPYREADPPQPRSAYARSKLQGEQEVRQATPNHLIVRTNLYGWSSGRKRTFGEWLFKSLQGGEPITLFEDVFYTPIYTVDLAERIERLLEVKERGVVHLGGGETVSKARFGTLLAEAAGLSLKSVRFGSVREAPLAAARGGDTSLDGSRFRRWTGMDLPDCRSGIARFLKDRETPLSLRFAGQRANKQEARVK